MRIEIGSLDAKTQYKVVSSLVVPRPIALISSLSAQGTPNVAPFSLFNIFGEDPPVVIVGLQDHWDGTVKDTTVNVLQSGEFVINLVDEDILQAMNVCATDFPEEIDEAEMAGITLVPCETVRPQRIREAPASLECRRISVVQVAQHRKIVLGRVTTVHVRDGLMDPATFRMDLQAYKPVGRLFGSLYTRTSERIDLPTKSYSQWLEEQDIEP